MMHLARLDVTVVCSFRPVSSTHLDVYKRQDGSLICRELLGLEKGEDLEEPAVRTEAYYQSRPCVKACRRAAEILEEYVKEQKRK